MPEARPRQSSLGARRRQPKAHIPYRGDNNVTKKTGIKVAHNPGSDGFEPYEQFAQQADKLTPYHVKGRAKNASQDPDSEDDEDGELPMDIDSPIHYIANSRQPTSPVSRVGQMSRPVARNSSNQFADLPSPHARSPNKSRPSVSRLSRSYVYSDDEPISSHTRRTSGYEDMSIDTGFQELSPHRSFTELDQDGMEDDDDDLGGMNEPDEPPMPSPKHPKGKGKSSTVERADDMDEPPVPSPKRRKGKNSRTERESSPAELPPRTQTPEVPDNIEHPEEVYEDPVNDSGEEEEEPPVPAKKVRLDKGKEKMKTRGQSKKKENHFREGVRRSQRRPIKPLEWWRNEKYVYERPTHGDILVPHIKEILRIPEEPKEPLGKHATKRKRGRSRSKTVPPPGNPEEGWDDDTPAISVVLDWKSKEPLPKRITCLAKNVNPQPAANNEWFFQRIFGDDSFIAAGQLIIPVHGRKPTKTTKDNTYIFYVLEGAINLKVYETSMILCTGAMFMIPRGNTYFIENIGDRDAKLFFTQARKEDAAEGSVSPRKSVTRPRSTSVAGTSKDAITTKRANTTGV